MLIEVDEVIEILFQSGILKNISGAFHIGAHDCEELCFYNQLGIIDQDVIWIEAINQKCLENKKKRCPKCI